MRDTKRQLTRGINDSDLHVLHGSPKLDFSFFPYSFADRRRGRLQTLSELL